MSLDFPKVEFLRRIGYFSQGKIVYRRQDDDEYKKNIFYQNNDSFEREILSNEKKEMRLKTILNGILGCALGCFVAKNQKILTKIVVSILGALSAIAATIMYYANKLKKSDC